MADFENLGFEVSVQDNASTRLQDIINKLEKIQKLQNGGGGVGGSKVNSNLVNNQNISTTQNARIQKSLLSQQNSAISLEKAYQNLSSAMGRYENAQASLNTALINFRAAEQRYNDAITNPLAKLKERETATRNLAKAQDALLKAQNNLYIAEQGVGNAQRTIDQRENSFASAQIRTEQAQLSDVEKYLQRVNAETDKLNDKKYEEARRIELANQARKKEIDQRLEQELGIKKTTNSLTTYIAKLTSVVALARQFANFISGAIQETASYVENLNLFAVTFGNTYKETADWALDLANNFGFASNEIIKFTGLFKQLSTAIGIADETSTEMSKTLTQLGLDFASFYNISTESAMEKLQAGIYSGQTKPLRSIGIDVTYQSIDNLLATNEALAQFNTTSKQLTQSDKAIARLILVMQSGENAFGDMSKTINTLQNQMRIFQGSLSNFKLAIGDLFDEPLRQTLVFLNGIIIAVTDIIRVFKPLTDADTKFSSITTLGEDTDETADSLDNLTGKLASFDKFNVLNQGENGELSITEALTAELEKQQALYAERLATMESIANEATVMAEKIKNFFIITDEEGNFVDWTENAKLLVSVLGGLVTLLSYNLVLSLVKSIVTMEAASLGANLLATAILSGVVYAIIKAVEAFNEGDKWGGIIAILFGVTLVAAFVAFQLAINGVSNAFTSLLGNLTLILAGISILALGITEFFNSWGDMGTWQKIITAVATLTAGIIGFVVATKALHLSVPVAIGLGAVLAGGVALIGTQLAKNSVYKFADGGYSNANLIMTHENGKREWVGKAAGSSAIVNDTQMSDIMEMAVAKGVYSAMTAKSSIGGNTATNETIVVKIGEEAVFNAVRKTAKRQGVDFANI